jgi:hypothetical protein
MESIPGPIHGAELLLLTEPKFDVYLGMDVISTGIFNIDGPRARDCPGFC